MNTTIGVSQASLAGTTLATTSGQTGFLGFFCSPALSGAQTIGTGAFSLNVADSESNLNANFVVAQANVYVWRPGTGAKVGTIADSNLAGFGALEATSASSEQVSHSASVPGSGVSASDGDVIICELWSPTVVQGMATAYTATVFYDGTTENTTENAVVSNHASYIQFAENLTFQGPAVTGTASSTLPSVTTSITGAVSPRGAAASTLAAITTSVTGTVVNPITGTATIALAAVTAAASGTERFTGTVNSTLAAVTASATGTERFIGTVAATLPSVTTSVTGAETMSGSASPTLAGLSVSATGTVAAADAVVGTAAVTLSALAVSATGSVSGVAAQSAPPSGAPGGKRRIKFRGRFYDSERDRYQLARDVQDWLEEKPAPVAEAKPVKVKVAKKTIVLPTVELTAPEIQDFESVVRELNLQQQAVTDYIAGLRALAQRIEMEDEEDAIALLLVA